MPDLRLPEPDIRPCFEWLVDGAPGAKGPAEVVARLGPLLNEGHVPVARIAAFVRTLHPHIMGRSFVWRRGTEGVTIGEAPYAILDGPVYIGSPAGIVCGTGQEFRIRFEPGVFPEQADLRLLAESGMTDYFALPMRFLDGQVHAIAASTDQPGGFRESDLDAIRKIVRPLSRVAEILALRRTATNLLSAYVGRDAGERILQGHVQRGDTENIRCVTWFADLRGFTGLSATRDPKDIILLLNRIFDCQVPAVERGGGEVLKFMGDGMLAIFPIGGRGTSPGGDVTEEETAFVADRALAAAKEAFASLDAANTANPDEPLSFGIALHVGEVAYGNIGGIGRLDFTCIGPSVNLASRIEGLTAQLDKRLLLSEAFAALLPAACRRVGAFPLKGLDDEVVVYEPI